MSKKIKYLIEIPGIEIEAIHARAAKEEALRYYKRNIGQISWSEIE